MKRETASLRGRWMLVGLGALIAPKCLLCLLAYAAVITGPELCGATETNFPLLPVLGLVFAGASLAGLCRARRCE